MIQPTIRLIQALISGALVLAAHVPSLQIPDLDGTLLQPFQAKGNAAVVFFLSTECPISRFYATEIQRICSSYQARGAGCTLIYEDLPLEPATVRKHLAEFGYRGIPAAIDQTGNIAKVAGALVTPEAVVVDAAGIIRYRGRIDNFYADLGKPRRQTTTHDLTDALEAVLAGQTVAHPEVKGVGCFITSPEVLNGIQPEGGTK